MPSSENLTLLAFGAHPDDIEFGCGGVLAQEALRGAQVRLVVCSLGEAGTNGTPETRRMEALAAAKILGGTVQFLEMGGDAHLRHTPEQAIAFARLIREVKPDVVLAPSLVENQHPDHVVVGRLARDAARLARFGGLKELKDLPPHPIRQLFYYAITVEGEPTSPGVMIDLSAAAAETWKRSMEAHASQLLTRNYVELQLTRARLNGLRIGGEAAVVLYPNDSLVFDSLQPLTRGARRF